MTYLWSPRDWGPKRIRRNPQAVLYQPVLNPDDWGYDNTITPNGIATLGAAEVAVSAVDTLHKAGTRGATALGALAGLAVTFSVKGALIGGALGYFGGKYLTVLADKVLAASAVINKVEKAAS